MDHYQGAVLYVDILGISDLTKKKAKLTPVDYEAWGIKKPSEQNEHFFCAKLLVSFRACLKEIKKKHQGIQLTQLSDCAFIWSRKPSAVALAAQDLMWALVRKGILCRGGIAFGDVIEPVKVATSLGQFVLGEAVSKAVEYEGKGKGCRLFTEPELVLTLTGKGPHCDRVDVETFVGLVNPLNGETVDEFRWYLQNLPGSSALDDQTKLLGLLELMSALKHSPRFNWNETSEPGKLQLACSIASLSKSTHKLSSSKDYIFSVEHLMATPIMRSEALQTKVFKIWSDEAAKMFARKNRQRS
ncbi:hypothetical protein [Pseudomonas sp. Irchel 3E19]|uniref:hypothetical protein n=1 Tax=Pseudomonas sp. Irchel 3E19 TaxID=2008981 RepID=UPI000BA3F017|nr:hypothetical protein [Pseudomonas sp. Irchel 3E19]